MYNMNNYKNIEFKIRMFKVYRMKNNKIIYQCEKSLV